MLIMISCEKDDSEDALTNGTWVLVEDQSSLVGVNLKFNSNGTYLAEYEQNIGANWNWRRDSSSGESNNFQLELSKVLGMSRSVSGEYSNNGSQIDFISLEHVTIERSDLPGSGYEINITPGSPIGNYFGYEYIGQNGSAMEDSIAVTAFPFLLNRLVFELDSSKNSTWEILSLTNELLQVESNNIVGEFYKK
jgi:hypothetical protein